MSRHPTDPREALAAWEWASIRERRAKERASMAIVRAMRELAPLRWRPMHYTGPIGAVTDEGHRVSWTSIDSDPVLGASWTSGGVYVHARGRTPAEAWGALLEAFSRLGVAP